MSFFLFLFLFISSAQASLQKITIQNLDLLYNKPQGSGTLEKLTIGVSTTKKATYPIEVFRRESTFEITSPFVNLEWLDPMAYVHNMEKARSEDLDIGLDYLKSTVKATSLGFIPEGGKEFFFKNLNAVCEGKSQEQDPFLRLRSDCLESLRVRASHVELPFGFIENLKSELPDDVEEHDILRPADDFSLQVTNGSVYSYLKIKLLVRAYLKIWARAQYENEGKVLAIKVSTIKYGILPVTTLVMNILQREVNSPGIKIDPPWIRIELGEP